MARLLPREDDGPLEAVLFRVVMRIPLEGGGRLAVELSIDEAANLAEGLQLLSSGG